MRYYGNKTRLLPIIEDVVKTTGINGSSKFVDLFSGTGAVSRHFKKLGYTIYSNDILEFSYCFSKALIENNIEPHFQGLIEKYNLVGIDQVLNYLNSLRGNQSGFILKNYSPKTNRNYFTEKNAKKIDAIRRKIEEWHNDRNINSIEYYYLITVLISAINLISNVSGTYAAYLKTWDKRALNDLHLTKLDIISNQRKNKAFKKDANQLIRDIESEIIYLDPPYNSRQYASNYFLLELIAEGWFNSEPKIYGKTGMRDYSNQKSLYNKKSTAEEALYDLVTNARCDKLILSYSNEGIIPHETLVKILRDLGKVEVYSTDHKRYKSINQKRTDPVTTQEFLYLVSMKRKYKIKANNLNGSDWLKNSISIWKNLSKNEEERKLNHPATFPLSLASKLIDTFVSSKHSTVLDCFVGTGTTLLAGLQKEMDVIGVDINSSFKEIFIERLNKYSVTKGGFENIWKYIVDDSTKLTNYIETNSIDLCITSPPYWDILNMKRSADNKSSKNYSNMLEDLGNISDYTLFLKKLNKVFTEVFAVLKKDRYFILNVMDLRKKGDFFPLHIDVIAICEEIGFTLQDIIIWDRQTEYNNIRPLGYPYKFIVNKVHEYLIILRK